PALRRGALSAERAEALDRTRGRISVGGSHADGGRWNAVSRDSLWCERRVLRAVRTSDDCRGVHARRLHGISGSAECAAATGPAARDRDLYAAVEATLQGRSRGGWQTDSLRRIQLDDLRRRAA